MIPISVAGRPIVLHLTVVLAQVRVFVRLQVIHFLSDRYGGPADVVKVVTLGGWLDAPTSAK